MAHTTGFRRKTRQLFTRCKNEKTKLNELLKQYEIGKSIVVKINSSFHKGMPHYRFQGRVGKIVNKIGFVYYIDFPSLNKKLITNTAHIHELQN